MVDRYIKQIERRKSVEELKIYYSELKKGKMFSAIESVVIDTAYHLRLEHLKRENSAYYNDTEKDALHGYRNQQLCWTCKNCINGCNWSREFKPVEGWTVRKTTVKMLDGLAVDSYAIVACPQYKYYREE